jgi:hypothetical protein
LLTLPFILNVHYSGFVAPNEEPKWAVLMITCVLMPSMAAWHIHKNKASVRLALTIPSFLSFQMLFGNDYW